MADSKEYITADECAVRLLAKPAALSEAAEIAGVRDEDIAIATQRLRTSMRTVARPQHPCKLCDCWKKTQRHRARAAFLGFGWSTTNVVSSDHEPTCQYYNAKGLSSAKTFEIEYQAVSYRQGLTCAVAFSLELISHKGLSKVQTLFRISHKRSMWNSPVTRLMHIARQAHFDFVYDGTSPVAELLVKSLRRLFCEGKASPTDVDLAGDETYLHKMMWLVHGNSELWITLIKILVAVGVNPSSLTSRGA